MFFGRRKNREPGLWFDPEEGPGLFPGEGTPEYHTRLVSDDLAAAYYDPQGEKVEVLVAPNLERYEDLMTPFFGYVRDLLRERGLRSELGRAKAQEIETRARDYPYYKEKVRFKALSRIQLNQPIPIRGRPEEFWWPPETLGGRRPTVRGGTAEERQAIYDAEAEQWAKWLILHGQFLELVDFVDHDTWLQQEGL